jgi:hypothetical protein
LVKVSRVPGATVSVAGWYAYPPIVTATVLTIATGVAEAAGEDVVAGAEDGLAEVDVLEEPQAARRQASVSAAAPARTGE